MISFGVRARRLASRDERQVAGAVDLVVFLLLARVSRRERGAGVVGCPTSPSRYHVRRSWSCTARRALTVIVIDCRPRATGSGPAPCCPTPPRPVPCGGWPRDREQRGNGQVDRAERDVRLVLERHRERAAGPADHRGRGDTFIVNVLGSTRQPGRGASPPPRVHERERRCTASAAQRFSVTGRAIRGASLFGCAAPDDRWGMPVFCILSRKT